MGITTSLSEGEDGSWRQSLDGEYVRAVEEAGGSPVIVPMVDSNQAMQPLLDGLDGLVITGGRGITERLVGDLPEDLPPTLPRRARADLWAWEAMHRRHRPILGICYGMQFINARLGGSIYADAQKQLGTGPHARSRNGGEEVIHEIDVAAGSLLGRLAVGDRRVNSQHLQAVDQVGEGLEVSARSPDGLIEGIETPDGHLIGVQFHPELMGGTWAPLFENLVGRAGP
ncbi:MAG: gamma-glutamyl-gamma-aminobutyrate hydrolase [Gemmatimonadaceae bacterium]|nr:gamma-glutamyl-gamma-aminobutyrate hydrolase [Gemmatimonadaceae bacterium]